MTNPVNAVTNESGRYYIHPFSNEKFWSVSTICKALAKPFLIPWAAKMAAEYAVKEWDYLGTLKANDRIVAIKSRQSLINRRASARGTQVHQGIESFIAAGGPDDFDFKSVAATDDLAKWNEEQPEWKIRYAEIQPYYDGFVLWHRRFRPRYIHSETTVWNRTEHYAGTLDIIAELPHYLLPGRDEPGCTAIFDAKSGKDIYPEVGLQLAAYSRGEFYLHAEKGETPLPHIDAAFALHVTENGTRMIPVKIEDDVYRSFLYIREAFRFDQVISKTILGPEVATGPGEGA